MQVRAARDADRPLLVEMALAAYREVATRQFGSWDENAQAARFEAKLLRLPFEVAELAGRPVAAVSSSVHADHVFLNDLFVLPELQDRGLGSELLEREILRARRLGLPLRLHTLAVNRAARLFARHGFVETSRGDAYVEMECAGRGVPGGSRAVPGRPEQVELAPFVADRDRTLLDSWMKRPHVSEWWGDPCKALDELTRPPKGGGEALILADGDPVGYVRWQVPPRGELDAAGLSDLPADVIDIDIAIGDPDRLGLGVGSRALSMLRERLELDGVTTVMLATSVDNARAVRAYEKAGFRRRRAFVDTDGETYWLMMWVAVPS